MSLKTLLAEAPLGIQLLKRDPRGYPVPWFVDTAAPPVNGGPDFRIMDGKRLKIAIKERRCWVCGLRLREEPGTFVAGPMCGINRTSSEPPCHLACARWSAMACPFLSQPKRIRDEENMPANAAQTGIGIKRNPGVVMLWTSQTYRTWSPDQGAGVLFHIGEPLGHVEWFAHGRSATRAEVIASIESGLPLLLTEAAKGGPADCFALGQMAQEFLRHVPAEDPPEMIPEPEAAA